MVTISGTPSFLRNRAESGSGGGMYCVSVTNLAVEGAWFINNAAVWGGGVATFSSGSSSSASSSSSMNGDSSSKDEAASSGSASLAFSNLDAGTSDVNSNPSVFSSCNFVHNRASEDGGGICKYYFCHSPSFPTHSNLAFPPPPTHIFPVHT